MDGTLYAAINGLAGSSDRVDDVFEMISRYGPYVLVGLLVLLWFWPGSRRLRDLHQWGAVAAVASAGLALGVNQVIIHIWARPRPFVAHAATLLLAPSHDPSFPSDHAAGAFAIAVAILLAARRLGLFALLFAALLAFSRVYTGEHYVSDVVAGAAIGSVVALLVFQLRPLVTPLMEPPLRLARRLHLA